MTKATARGLRFAKSEARKLARKGRLIDETFKLFQRAVYPGAPQDQVAALRVAFFAGAAEIFALQMLALDPGAEPTADDMQFMSDWADEIERFHNRTIAAAIAADPSKSN